MKNMEGLEGEVIDDRWPYDGPDRRARLDALKWRLVRWNNSEENYVLKAYLRDA